MKILIDIPTDQYNEIVYVNYERLRDIVRDGVVLEECEDAISREQALLALTGMDLPTDRDKLIALFTERIQHLPPVTRPKGKWIKVITDKDDFGETWHFKCSICGKKSNKGYRPLENYCHNCGAEMEDEE